MQMNERQREWKEKRNKKKHFIHEKYNKLKLIKPRVFIYVIICGQESDIGGIIIVDEWNRQCYKKRSFGFNYLI